MPRDKFRVKFQILRQPVNPSTNRDEVKLQISRHTVDSIFCEKPLFLRTFSLDHDIFGKAKFPDEQTDARIEKWFPKNTLPATVSKNKRASLEDLARSASVARTLLLLSARRCSDRRSHGLCSREIIRAKISKNERTPLPLCARRSHERILELFSHFCRS